MWSLPSRPRRRSRRAPALAAFVIAAGVAALLSSPAAQGAPPAPASEIRNADGVVYRYYPGYGYRFQPLLSFARLNGLVSARSVGPARRLASALVARGVRRGDAVYWQYDFPFLGGPVPWTSGFAQAVGAQSLARASVLVGEPAFARTAEAAFRALRTLVMPLGGGLWVREYGFTSMAILNAQLQSVISLESYARVAENPAAARVAAAMYRASRTLLPRFGVGCWSRYSLGGASATRSYHAYHVYLLRRLALAHREADVWWSTYVRWSRCLGIRPGARPQPPVEIPWRRASAAAIGRFRGSTP